MDFAEDKLKPVLGSPVFNAIVALDFYDGPVFGLAMDASGEGARFWSVGEDADGMRRAFIVETIEGNWRSLLETLRAQEGVLGTGGFFLPAPSLLLDDLERGVRAAVVKEQFVGVGRPYLDGLVMVRVNASALTEFGEREFALSSFLLADRLVRGEK